jgi:YbbR domain-containing protein
MKAPWPFRHLGLKVLSVGLALMLWMVVSGEETVERGLRVPLEFQQFPAGLELQEEMPSTVDVRVRGGSGTLSRLSPADVVAVLDLHGAKPGRRLFHLTADQVRAPFGVEVTQLNPPSIALTFEATGMRQVPVSPAVEGKPAPGFIVGKVTSDPEMVDVIGPETAVGRVTEAITEPVSVADAKQAVSESVTVGFVEPSVRLKTPRAATVTVAILPAPAERQLRGRAVHLRNLAANLSGEVVPSSVDVGLRGSRESLGHIAPDDISAYVDLSGLGVGQYSLTVHADAPGDVGVTTITPMSVQVRISSVQQ